MGNSRTSRYADGKDLYHADAETQRLLRVLAKHRPKQDPQKDAPVVPQRFLDAARRAPALQPASVRRLGGEIARLLMENACGLQIRALARRHRLDEGDVARLWARTLFRPAEAIATLPVDVEGSS